MSKLLPSFWAMKPEALSILLDQFQVAKEMLRRNDTSPAQTEAPYTLDGSVAIIPVSGPLSKNGLSLGDSPFLASMRGLSTALRCAEADPTVRAILLDVDSPGGTVDGTEELADTVAAVNVVKPIYAYADGLMASAGYWLSCHAHEIAAPATAEVGSIGVVLMQREMSKALEGMGVTYSVITAGHYKAAGNPMQPLSEEMRAYLQDGVDQVYELFLQNVEKGRSVSREKALAMADGRVFMAGEALKIGLIDRVCSRQNFINHIQTTIKEATMPMTLAQFMVQHPEAAAELRTEALAEARTEAQQNAQAQVSQSRAEAAEDTKAEQDRMLALAEALLDKKSAQTLRSLALSGVTPEQAVNMRSIFAATVGKEAQADHAQEMLDALKGAHAHQVNTMSADSDAPQDFQGLVAAHQEKHDCTHGAAITAVATANPEAHSQWLKKQEGAR